MEVVLLEDIKGLGVRGDVRTVNDGYAMNFLIPKKMAVDTAAEEGSRVMQQKKEKDRHNTERQQAEMNIFDSLPATMPVTVRMNEQGTPFSAVTGTTIASQLNERGIAAPASWFPSVTIKSIGEHTVTAVHRNEQKNIIVTVTAQQ